MSPWDRKIRLESQFSRRYCQTFSTGLSSGHFGGSGRRVMLAGTTSLSERCHPAWSSISTACAPGVTVLAISARCRVIAALLQRGRPGAPPRPAPSDLVLLPDAGLVGKPHLYRPAGRIASGDLCQAGGKGFLKTAGAAGSWA